jgi:hypothetical protein
VFVLVVEAVLLESADTEILEDLSEALLSGLLAVEFDEELFE